MEIDEASGPLHFAAGDNARDAARLTELWQRFSEADGETAFCSSWLALQCSMVGAAARAAVVLRPGMEGVGKILQHVPHFPAVDVAVYLRMAAEPGG